MAEGMIMHHQPREEKRFIERQNSKLRADNKKQEAQRIRKLVETAMEKDPRIKTMREEEEVIVFRKWVSNRLQSITPSNPRKPDWPRRSRRKRRGSSDSWVRWGESDSSTARKVISLVRRGRSAQEERAGGAGAKETSGRGGEETVPIVRLVYESRQLTEEATDNRNGKSD